MTNNESMRPPSGIRIRKPSVRLNLSSLSAKVKAFPSRIAASFFLLGVINNVLFVIILSAALDLVGPDTPKSLVLLANILPSVVVKLVAPYVFEYVPYWLRVSTVVLINFLGMVLVSISSGFFGKLTGIAMASAASGCGEITFLQISYYYDSISLAAWSSGTGGAGIAGGLIYVASTTWMRISPQKTLLGSSTLPLIMALTYFILLPGATKGTRHVMTASGEVGYRSKYSAIDNQDRYLVDQGLEDVEEPLTLLRRDSLPDPPPSNLSFSLSHLRRKFALVRPLFYPFMLPLFLVYFAEYSINQGLSPTLLFDLEQMPFSRYRDVYPTYATIYQFGVFLSRSSSPFFRIHNLYGPALSQCALLVLFLIQALFVPIPSIYPIFLIILGEGVLGGLVYVNAFHNVSESNEIDEADKEFSIGVTGLADSLGVLVAALWSLWLEPTVCDYQVTHGRPYCKLS